MIDRKELRRKRNGLAKAMHDMERRIEYGQKVDASEYARIKKEYLEISLMKKQEIEPESLRIKTANMKKSGFTAINYLMLKDEGLTDADIIDRFNFGSYALMQFKKRHNLTKTEHRKPNKAEMEAINASIGAEFIALAEENGISFKVLKRRIIQDGWDAKRAATQEVENRRKK